MSHAEMEALATLLVVGIGSRLVVLVSVPEHVNHAAREVLGTHRVVSIAARFEGRESVPGCVSHFARERAPARPPVASIAAQLDVRFAATAVLAKRLGLRVLSSIQGEAIRRVGSTGLSTAARVTHSRGFRSTIAS
jgi:hypothetical protein